MASASVLVTARMLSMSSTSVRPISSSLVAIVLPLSVDALPDDGRGAAPPPRVRPQPDVVMDRATIDVYESRAADWAGLRPPRYRSRAAAFAGRCLPDLVRLDVGCGPGSYFADLGLPLAGLDGARA